MKSFRFSLVLALIILVLVMAVPSQAQGGYNPKREMTLVDHYAPTPIPPNADCSNVAGMINHYQAQIANTFGRGLDPCNTQVHSIMHQYGSTIKMLKFSEGGDTAYFLLQNTNTMPFIETRLLVYNGKTVYHDGRGGWKRTVNNMYKIYVEETARRP